MIVLMLADGVSPTPGLAASFAVPTAVSTGHRRRCVAVHGYSTQLHGGCQAYTKGPSLVEAEHGWQVGAWPCCASAMLMMTNFSMANQQQHAWQQQQGNSIGA